MNPNPDTYFSITSEVEGEYKEKGSKFIAYLFPIQSIEAFEARLAELKKQHLKSRHHCYAYRLGIDGNPYRINDDGEPSGTAGKPIYGQLIKENVSDIACVVVRYFGGTKLGTSGLIRAYKESTEAAFQKAEKKATVITDKISLQFEYEHLGKVMNVVQKLDIIRIDKDFTERATLVLTVAKSTVGQTINQLKALLLNRAVADITDETEVPSVMIFQ